MALFEPAADVDGRHYPPAYGFCLLSPPVSFKFAATETDAGETELFGGPAVRDEADWFVGLTIGKVVRVWQDTTSRMALYWEAGLGFTQFDFRDRGEFYFDTDTVTKPNYDTSLLFSWKALSLGVGVQTAPESMFFTCGFVF